MSLESGSQKKGAKNLIIWEQNITLILDIIFFKEILSFRSLFLFAFANQNLLNVKPVLATDLDVCAE